MLTGLCFRIRSWEIRVDLQLRGNKLITDIACRC